MQTLISYKTGMMFKELGILQRCVYWANDKNEQYYVNGTAANAQWVAVFSDRELLYILTQLIGIIIPFNTANIPEYLANQLYRFIKENPKDDKTPQQETVDYVNSIIEKMYQ